MLGTAVKKPVARGHIPYPNAWVLEGAGSTSSESFLPDDGWCLSSGNLTWILHPGLLASTRPAQVVCVGVSRVKQWVKICVSAIQIKNGEKREYEIPVFIGGKRQ